MKLSLIPKSGSLSDPEATGNIVSLVIVTLLISILFGDSILLFLYEPMVAIIPGIHEASQAATHVDLAKSFWSFTWFLLPFFSFWVVCLAFRVQDEVPLKKRWFFVALCMLAFLFFVGYVGTYYGSEDSVNWRGRIYGSSLFGMCFIGSGYWVCVYSFLFVVSRFFVSWTR